MDIQIKNSKYFSQNITELKNWEENDSICLSDIDASIITDMHHYF